MSGFLYVMLQPVVHECICAQGMFWKLGTGCTSVGWNSRVWAHKLCQGRKGVCPRGFSKWTQGWTCIWHTQMFSLCATLQVRGGCLCRHEWVRKACESENECVEASLVICRALHVPPQTCALPAPSPLGFSSSPAGSEVASQGQVCPWGAWGCGAHRRWSQRPMGLVLFTEPRTLWIQGCRVGSQGLSLGTLRERVPWTLSSSGLGGTVPWRIRVQHKQSQKIM